MEDMTPRLLILCLTAGCAVSGNRPVRCDADRSFSHLDRNGDGMLTPDDLQPGETAVAAVIEDSLTGERIGHIYSISTTDSLRFSPGEAIPPLRPWMGETEDHPQWFVLHSAEPEACNGPTDPQVIIQPNEGETGPLTVGRYENVDPIVITQEYYPGEDHEVHGAIVITEVTPEATVSGYLDGFAEGPLHDAFTQEQTHMTVTVQGFAWRDIPGEYVQP